MAKYSAFEEARRLVEDHLSLLEALYEAKKAQQEARSRLICSCPSCRTHREITLTWLAAMREPRQDRAAPGARTA